MTVQPIEYGDNGRVAREKINAMLQEVEEHIPSIWENNHWYLWETDTGVNATWPKGEDWATWPQWETWPQWPQGEKWEQGVQWEQGPQGETWPQGQPWTPWKDGKTPVKWVDYFTQQDIDSLNIPEKVSDLQNDAGYITDSDLPTNLSDLHNDVWFITNLVENLVNYYKKSETYTKSEIESLIGWIVGVKFEVVQTLPQSWENGTIYLISNWGTGSNLYDEYIWLSSQSRFEKIWTTEVDLSKYFNTETQNSDAITEWNTNLFMTNTERAKLQNQSWTNTGDETQATIKSKLWKASANQDGYLSREDWIRFNNGWGGSGSWDVIWPDWANNWNVAVFDWNTGKLIKDWGRLNSIAFSWLTSDMAGDNIEITGGWSSGDTAIKEWVDSINISNGVKDGLISFKTYWWTKQVSQEPILPAGYTQLEYIENPEGAYIETTITPSDIQTNPTIETKFKMLTTADKDYFWVNNTSPIVWDIVGTAPFIRWWWASPIQITYETWYTSAILWFRDVAHKLKVTGNPQTEIYVDDNLIGTNAVTKSFTSDLPIRIGTARTNYGTAQWYGFTIADWDDIKWNWIPAKNSNNEIWMYDTVSWTFFTNAGTGTFVAWPETEETKTVEVPEWYTILEYIETTGTQYLDTRITPTINAKARVKFMPTYAVQTGYFWARTGAYRFGCVVIGGTQFAVGMSYNTRPQNRTDLTLNEIYDTIIYNWYAEVNGTASTETTVTNWNNPWTFKLWSFRESTSYQLASWRFYVCKLWENDELLFNWIPVKNSSWVLGMYDTVSKTFFTNAGTGSFTAWPTLYPSIENPVKILTNNWVLKLINTLPDGYSQLEYIESSWTQAINTWIYDVDRIETELKSKYNRQYTAMFASYTDENSLCTRMIWNNSSVSLYYINSVAKTGRGCNFSQNTWHKVKLYEEGSNEVIDIDGTITSTPKVSWNPNTANIHLFANKNWADGAPTAFKYFKAYKGGELIFDAVPVKRKTDNVLWMYDKVSWTFLTNVGTGTFTAWPEVEQEKKMVIDWLQEIITDEIWNNATAELLLRVWNYVDEQEILNGNVIRKIWIKVLDGSETWGQLANNRWYYTAISDIKQDTYTKVQLICSHFSWYIWTDNTQSMPENSIGCNKNASTDVTNWNITIRPNLTTYPDVNSFKAFLKAQYDAGTPVIIIYPLNSDTAEFVSGQTLSTVDGENTIRVSQSSMEWLELKMEYMLPWDSKINFANPELLLPEWWNEWDILKIVNGVPTRVSPS